MDFQQKKIELIKLIKNYLLKKASLKELQNFAAEIIDYFTDTPNNQLPSHQNFEKEFWYTIWQIQHIADVEHEKENVTTKELFKALEYLSGKTSMPTDCIGKRPK